MLTSKPTLVALIRGMSAAARLAARSFDPKSLKVSLLALVLVVLGARLATDRLAVIAYLAAQAAVTVVFLTACRRAERQAATRSTI